MIGRKSRRKRDRKGRFSEYDSEKQADRGYRAHETRLQTWYRKAKWSLLSLFGRRRR